MVRKSHRVSLCMSLAAVYLISLEAKRVNKLVGPIYPRTNCQMNEDVISNNK